VKIGDLVRRHNSTLLGIVVEIMGSGGGLSYLKIRWDGEYGTFWTSPKAVEVVSEYR
jgi:hypothetical protein